jgi:hypothetical protein
MTIHLKYKEWRKQFSLSDVVYDVIYRGTDNISPKGKPTIAAFTELPEDARPSHTWTVCAQGRQWFLQNGIHRTDVMGYIITKEPWVEGQQYEVEI